MAHDENRIIAAAFALYPGWWRERYLEEAHCVTEDLVAAGRSPWTMASNLVIGALRARVSAAGMPPSYDAWARRTCAVVALATAPTVVVVTVMLTVRQKLPSTPHVIPATETASALYLALLFGLLLLISTMIWGYFSLSGGLREAGTNNPRHLRILARAPGYLALLGVILFVVSAFLLPHSWQTQGGQLKPVGGHPALGPAVLEASALAWILCGVTTAVLVFEVARKATLSLGTLAIGLVTARVMVGVLWLMTACVTALSLRYGTGVAALGGSLNSGYITVFGTGHALVILASVLGAMATVATFGTLLAGRSFHVARRLAVLVDASS